VPHGTITLTVDGGSVSTSCGADTDGSFSSCAYAVLAAPAGTYTVMATDSSASFATARYTV
jgi:hypothetical protein